MTDQVETTPADTELIIGIKEQLDERIWEATARLFSMDRVILENHEEARKHEDKRQKYKDRTVGNLARDYQYKNDMANDQSFRTQLMAQLKTDPDFQQLIVGLFSKELRRLVKGDSSYEYDLQQDY